MNLNHIKSDSASYASILRAFVVGSMLLLFAACGPKKELAGPIDDRDSLPVMATTDVTTLVSDSGIMRYRVTTPEWFVYDKKVPSYWAFLKGVYLEQFDSIQEVKASIKADTAYFYDKKKLWHLIGHVHVKNREGDTFDSPELYWDQKLEKVYSDKSIEIQQVDRVIKGVGFQSNQQMTVYNINNIEGVFMVNSTDTIHPVSKDSLQRDSLSHDSLKLNNKSIQDDSAKRDSTIGKKIKSDSTLQLQNSSKEKPKKSLI